MRREARIDDADCATAASAARASASVQRRRAAAHNGVSARAWAVSGIATHRQPRAIRVPSPKLISKLNENKPESLLHLKLQYPAHSIHTSIASHSAQRTGKSS